ncbi:MAG: hypothetical protein CMF25_01525 [Kangiellaceae bacterium]|nr:hypothetical protein [Kangiellaceae bacterium]
MFGKIGGKKILTKLKHLKTVGSGVAQKKVLVEEKVIEGSESARFLDRMEKKRRATETKRQIDMRGKVDGTCKAYKHQDRTHYMDEKCIAIFEQALAEFDGRYTVGVYEDVTNAEHTHKAQHEREKEQQSQQGAATSSEGVDREAFWGFDSGGAQVPADAVEVDFIPFGYYPKRAEPRMTFVMELEVELPSGETISCKTKDISASGMLVTTKEPRLPVASDVVLVRFTTLETEHMLDCPEPVRYKALGVDQDDDKAFLRLIRTDLEINTPFDPFITEFIDKNRHRYKVDLKDEISAFKAKAFEYLHAPVHSEITFFVSAQTGRRPKLAFVARSRKTARWVDEWQEFFKAYDLTPIISESRISKVIKNKDAPSLVIYTFRSDILGEEHYFCAADGEFSNSSQRDGFISIGKRSKGWRVFRMTLEWMNRPEEKKTKEVLQTLDDHSAEERASLEKQLKEVTHSGFLLDITRQHPTAYHDSTSDDDAAQLIKPFRVSTKHIGDNIVVQPGYFEHRSEPRYIHETPVIVKFGKDKIAGNTLDFSVNGMKVTLDIPCSAQRGEKVLVTMTKLQKLVKDARLSDIPYKVVSWQSGAKVITLEKDDSQKAKHAGDFFKKLIESNQAKLKVCLGETVETTLTRIVEGIMSETLHGMPFFISKDEESTCTLSHVGICEADNPIAEYFHLFGPHYDFAAVGAKEAIRVWVRELFDRGVDRDKVYSAELYCYAEHSEQYDCRTIVCKRDDEFTDSMERFDFLQDAARSDDFRAFKLVITRTYTFEEHVFQKDYDYIRNNSRNKAKQLREEIDRVVASGQLFDVTKLVLSREKISP